MQLQSVTTVTIPGYRIFEYLLVLNPHEELRNKIMKVKREFYDQYKASTALGNKSDAYQASWRLLAQKNTPCTAGRHIPKSDKKSPPPVQLLLERGAVASAIYFRSV